MEVLDPRFSFRADASEQASIGSIGQVIEVHLGVSADGLIPLLRSSCYQGCRHVPSMGYGILVAFGCFCLHGAGTGGGIGGCASHAIYRITGVDLSGERGAIGIRFFYPISEDAHHAHPHRERGDGEEQHHANGPQGYEGGIHAAGDLAYREGGEPAEVDALRPGDERDDEACQ